jgi:S-adenosylmethionine decarboxylase
MTFSPGTHLLIDQYGGQALDDLEKIRVELNAAARCSDVSVLGESFHRFPDRAGVTGILLLEESHISIHTWPELDFSAIDIFMCGAADPHLAANYLAKAFKPKRIELKTIERGQG